MKGKQIVAIDVGSANVVIAVGAVEEDGRVEIKGIATEPVEGITAGRVDNSETVGRAVRTAKERLEERLGLKITEAYVGLSGDYIRCEQVTDHVYVRDDNGSGCSQISERDIEELDRRMQSVNLPDDREEIITKEPLSYKVDEKIVKEPIGEYGYVLSATYNFVLSDRTMRERLRICLNKLDITIKEFVPNAMISHLGVATVDDMEDGAVIINLGAGLTDVTVVQSGKMRYFASIPVGVGVINNDIRAYGIPNSYVETLKVNYGSAVQELAMDDKITFPHARKGTAKSIRRKNLAKIIEERLIEIAEWVRKEIKEAGCGSRFSPLVLLTGGGAEMQNIEQLFARELKVEEARSVYPEYGFTESMGEHITTRAYATIASLLLYGAKRGMCAVAMRMQSPVQPQQPYHAPQPQQPAFGDAYSRNVAESSFAQGGNVSAPRPVITPRPATPKPEVPVVETGTLGAVEPELSSEAESEIEIEVDGGKTKDGRLNKFMNKITELFTGKDDEYTF
ncbi:MAG: cell division protein FtsA [Alistipes sp.]|nr:cell division protein FtsA [Alistipes sp.]